MYGNAYIDPNEKLQIEESPELLAAFEARIARGEKIEPNDWMPALYRKQLIRMKRGAVIAKVETTLIKTIQGLNEEVIEKL
jgi:hypothetical protein